MEKEGVELATRLARIQLSRLINRVRKQIERIDLVVVAAVVAAWRGTTLPHFR